MSAIITDPVITVLRAFKRDFPLFAAECIPVQDEDGMVVPFVMNRMQRYLWDLEGGRAPDYFGQYRKETDPFWAVVLKIRRAGSSLYFTNRLLWKCLFKPNTVGHIRAHDDETTDHLFFLLKYAYKNLPAEVRPMCKLDNRNILYFANPDSEGPQGLESKVTVATAGSPHKSAGFGIHHLHLAEFGRYDEITDTKKMMTTVKQTIPYRPHTSVVIESTAHGEGTFKKYWEDDSGGFLKAFISYVALEKYSFEIDRHFELSGVEESIYGNEEREAELVEKEVHRWFPELDPKVNHSEIEHKVYCILAWRRHRIDRYCEGDKKVFDQEFPITPDRAFMLSGDPVFNSEKLYFIIQDLKKRDKDIADGFASPVCTRYKFDTSLDITDKNNDPEILWDLTLSRSGYGPLHIYEEPIASANYVMGLDPAEGLVDGDESALVLLRIPDLTEVAVWNKPIDPDLFADLAFILGHRYNKALLGVEMNPGGHGTEVLRRLLRHLRYPASRIWRDRKFDRTKIDHEKRYGLHMNGATKQAVLDHMKGVIRDDALEFRHLENAKEHKNFKFIVSKEGLSGHYWAIAEDNSKRSANLVMATAIAVHMSRVYSSYASANKEKPQRNSIADWRDKYGFTDRPTQLNQFGRRFFN